MTSKEMHRILVERMTEFKENPLEIGWQEALDRDLTHSLNFSYEVNRFQHYESTKDWLRDWYKSQVSEIKELQPEYPEHPVIQGLMTAIDLLPHELPDKVELRFKDLEPLLEGLWKYYEDHDIGFDLGDDGTDEMEENMENVYYVLQVVAQYEDRLGGNLMYLIPHWYLKSQYLNEHEAPYIWLRLGWIMPFLREMEDAEQNNSTDDRTPMAIVLRDIQDEYRVIIEQ